MEYMANCQIPKQNNTYGKVVNQCGQQLRPINAITIEGSTQEYNERITESLQRVYALCVCVCLCACDVCIVL